MNEWMSDDKYFYISLRRPQHMKNSEKHYHSQFEIYYLKNGTCNYLIEDTLFQIHAGDIALIPANIIHKTSYGDISNHSRFLINCTDYYLPEYAYSLIKDGNYIYRNPKVNADLYDLFKRIDLEYKKKDDFSVEMFTSYVHMLFILLSRNQNCYRNERVNNYYVEKILNTIKHHFDSDITLAKMAAEYSITQEHLSRIFKKETGMGFNEYLTNIRLSSAEQLLMQETKQSIAEIAFACGFNDSNYFSVKFKNMYGVSPLQFQKKCTNSGN